MTKTLVMESLESLDRQGLAWIVALGEVEGNGGNPLLERIGRDFRVELMKRDSRRRRTKSIPLKYDLSDFNEGEMEYNGLIFDALVRTFQTLRNPKAARFCEAVAEQLFSETQSN